MVMASARGWGQGRGNRLMQTESQFHKMKTYGDGWWGWLHHIVNTFNVTELNT